MKRIYTRTGDRGTTGIHGGERVEKDDCHVFGDIGFGVSGVERL